MPSTTPLLVTGLLWALLAPVGGTPGPGQAAGGGQTDLDRLMARVLERREQTWKTLHDYVLDETERFEIRGPGEVKLQGVQREFTWYVREGYLVRSPLRFNGVALSETERRQYEERWLRDEKRREARRNERSRATASATASAGADGAQAESGRPAPGDAGNDATPSLDAFVGERGEPRFVSEAYFLRFKFEPGNYYLAGRERFEGRDVLRVEYYPTKLFRHERRTAKPGDAPAPGRGSTPEAKAGKKTVDEEDITRKLNKVALVTLWIDPAEQQIVRYTFDNVDFGFLPGRWLVRVDKVAASMTMSNVFEGVWLPKQITMAGGAVLANGTYTVQYGRDFSNYRKAETRARIRGEDR